MQPDNEGLLNIIGRVIGMKKVLTLVLVFTLAVGFFPGEGTFCGCLVAKAEEASSAAADAQPRDLWEIVGAMEKRIAELEAVTASQAEEIRELKSRLGETPGEETPQMMLLQDNLFHPEAVTVGALGSTGMVNESRTDYYTTDFERIQEGKSYSGWQIYGPLGLINPAVYDQDRQFIQAITPDGRNIIHIPEGIGAYWLRVSVEQKQAAVERQPRIVEGTAEKPWRAYQNEEKAVSVKTATAGQTQAPAPSRQAPCYAWLPDILYCAVGRTLDLYNHQVCINADRFHLSWVCSKGFAEERRFTITAETMEDLPLQLNIYDDSNQLVFQKDSVIRCVAPLKSGSVSVLAIGDSMTYGGAQWQAEIQNHLSGGAVRFAGTQTTTFRENEYHHEGFNGITALGFLTRSEHRGAKNPFYNASIEGFDYRYYLESTGLQPDAVLIELGTNDMNAASSGDADEKAENIAELVRRIKKDSPDTPVYVCNAIYRSGQDGIAHQMNSQGYSASSGKYKYEEDMKIFNLMVSLNEKLSDIPGVYTVPLALCHDSEYNYGKQTVPLNSRSQESVVIPADSVHPNKNGEDPETFGYDIVGYLQFADAIFSVLSGTLGR